VFALLVYFELIRSARFEVLHGFYPWHTKTSRKIRGLGEVLRLKARIDDLSPLRAGIAECTSNILTSQL
jgi:hypothetical protein